ncbi:MAG: divergent polysaccharide deacetylase family protein [Alphaproteobacteria bacterium]|nr:divergent polysaccharide deacetylase family protein [Alphaproteobacteria bacterium]
MRPGRAPRGRRWHDRRFHGRADYRLPIGRLVAFLCAATVVGAVSGSVAALSDHDSLAFPGPRRAPAALDARVALPPTPSAGASVAHVSLVIAAAPAETIAPPVQEARWRPPPAARRGAPMPGRAEVAIVIDDLGLNAERTDRVISIDAPLTLAFLPYGRLVRPLAHQAREAGHEIILHMPMEPLGPENPGPNALYVSQSSHELVERLEWALAQFDGMVGVNNHMGSRLTEDPAAMRTVMGVLAGRPLYFLDSRTSQRSLAYASAQAAHVPAVRRDVFLDHEISADFVDRQLAEMEMVARRTGTAIAIGHPHDVTIEKLTAWLATAEARGFTVVPASRILAIRSGRADLIAALGARLPSSLE